MPSFFVNFDSKFSTHGQSEMTKREGDLVKAMKARSAASNQQGSNNSTSGEFGSGTSTSFDKFAKDMVASSREIMQLNQSKKNIKEGLELLSAVKLMITNSNGIKSRVDVMQKAWTGITLGREFQNADLKIILKIRTNISEILSSFKRLKFNGMNPFQSRMSIKGENETKGETFSKGERFGGPADRGQTGGGRGAVINFMFMYSSIRQSLTYVRENISNYNSRDALTQRFKDVQKTVQKMLEECENKSSTLRNVSNNYDWSIKKKEQKRKETIQQRQNQLSVSNVINILENQTGVGLGN